jgi:hypothetical protein
LTTTGATCDFTLQMIDLQPPLRNIKMCFVLDSEFLKTIEIYSLFDNIQLIIDYKITDIWANYILEMSNMVNQTPPTITPDPENAFNSIVTFDLDLFQKYPQGLNSQMFPYGTSFVMSVQYGKCCHGVIENVFVQVQQMTTSYNPFVSSLRSSPLITDGLNMSNQNAPQVVKYSTIYILNSRKHESFDLKSAFVHNIKRLYFKTPHEFQFGFKLYNQTFMFPLQKINDLYFCDLIITESDYKTIMNTNWTEYMAISKATMDGINFSMFDHALLQFKKVATCSQIIILAEMFEVNDEKLCYDKIQIVVV